MNFTIISLLAFSCAVLVQSCDITDCFCKLSVGGNGLQGVIPSGTGSVQSEMLFIQVNDSSNPDVMNTCSVTFNRGQGCCEDFTVTSGPIGSGCPQGSGVLECGEQIPFTYAYFSTATITIASSTATVVSTDLEIVTTIPTTLLTVEGTATVIVESTAEASITASATSYSDNLKKRQLTSTDEVSVSVGVAVAYAYVTLSTVVVVTSDATDYLTTDTVASTTTLTSMSVVTTTAIATSTVVVGENYVLEFGPQNGCAYIPSPFLNQTSYEADPSITQEQQSELCAQYCDSTSGCVSFGSNYFPPCGGNGASVYCILATSTYNGEMECGIGVGYDGCTIYQQGTVYQKQ